MWMYVNVYVYHYKAKSIDDDGSGGFLCCQTERRDERKKKEIKKNLIVKDKCHTLEVDSIMYPVIIQKIQVQNN